MESVISILPRKTDKLSLCEIYSLASPLFICDDIPLIRIAVHNSAAFSNSSYANLLYPFFSEPETHMTTYNIYFECESFYCAP